MGHNDSRQQWARHLAGAIDVEPGWPDTPDGPDAPDADGPGGLA